MSGQDWGLIICFTLLLLSFYGFYKRLLSVPRTGCLTIYNPLHLCCNRFGSIVLSMIPLCPEEIEQRDTLKYLFTTAAIYKTRQFADESEGY